MIFSYSLQNSLQLGIQLASSEAELESIYDFRSKIYSTHYPLVTRFADDPFDIQAYILYSKGDCGEITGTLRIVKDGPSGLPEEHTFGEAAERFRENGVKLAEAGRFAIKNQSPRLLKSYLLAAYQVARFAAIDVMFFVVREKDARFYRRLLNAEKLPYFVKDNFGSSHRIITLAWEIDKTPTTTFKNFI